MELTEAGQSSCHGDGTALAAEAEIRRYITGIFPSVLPLLPLAIRDAEFFFCGTCECALPPTERRARGDGELKE